jgi:mannosyltransferase
VLPYVSRYAQEARAFGLSAALVTLSFLLLLRAVEQPGWKRWTPYALAVAFVGCLHIVGLLILLSHGFFVAVSWYRTRSRGLFGWIGAAGLAVAALLPLVLLGQRQSGQISWIPEATLDRTLRELMNSTGANHVSVIVLGAAFLGIWPIGRRTATLALWAIAPFAVLFLASPHVELLVNRYMLFTLPAFCLLAANAVDRLTSTFGSDPPVAAPAWQRWSLPVMIILVAFGLGLRPTADARKVNANAEPDMRGAAQIIGENYEPGDSIGYHGGTPFLWNYAVSYYLPDDAAAPTRFQTPSNRQPILGGVCPAGVSCDASGGRLWLVNTDSPTDPFRAMNPAFGSELRSQYDVVTTYQLHRMTLTLLAPRS